MTLDMYIHYSSLLFDCKIYYYNSLILSTNIRRINWFCLLCRLTFYVRFKTSHYPNSYSTRTFERLHLSGHYVRRNHISFTFRNFNSQHPNTTIDNRFRKRSATSHEHLKFSISSISRAESIWRARRDVPTITMATTTSLNAGLRLLKTSN